MFVTCVTQGHGSYPCESTEDAFLYGGNIINAGRYVEKDQIIKKIDINRGKWWKVNEIINKIRRS